MQVKILSTGTVIMGDLVNLRITRSFIIFVLKKEVTVSYLSTPH